MKLKDLLKNLFEENNKKIISSNYPFDMDVLNSEILKQIKEKLLECDEFKDVEKLEIIEIPDIENLNGKIVAAKSYKLSENFKFGKVCYLYSISQTPEIFEPNKIYDSVKDGACITPVMYDPLNFKPTRKICIECSPEDLQDDILKGENKKKDELINLFKIILENQEEYTVKGERGFVVRGIIEEITVEGETFKEENFQELNLDFENQNFFTVFYLENFLNGDGQISLRIEKKHLPKKLKEYFISELGHKKNNINKEDLENFLKKFDYLL